MCTILKKLKKDFPKLELNENGFPKGICPDELGYMALCEDLHLTYDTCVSCWNQKHVNEI